MKRRKRRGHITAKVGARIRTKRVEKDIGPKHFADGLGVTMSQLSRYETGETPIDLETLAVVCRLLRCEPEVFLTGLMEG